MKTSEEIYENWKGFSEILQWNLITWEEMSTISLTSYFSYTLFILSCILFCSFPAVVFTHVCSEKKDSGASFKTSIKENPVNCAFNHCYLSF